MSVPVSATYRFAAPTGLALRNPVKVIYLFTTFPKITETFLQREVRALRRLPVELELFSLWGGEPRFEGLTVRRFSKAKLVALLWLLPYWVARKPMAFVSMFKSFSEQPIPSWKNLGETLIGISFAITHAALLSKIRPPMLNVGLGMAKSFLLCTSAESSRPWTRTNMATISMQFLTIEFFLLRGLQCDTLKP